MSCHWHCLSTPSFTFTWLLAQMEAGLERIKSSLGPTIWTSKQDSRPTKADEVGVGGCGLAVDVRLWC